MFNKSSIVIKAFIGLVVVAAGVAVYKLAASDAFLNLTSAPLIGGSADGIASLRHLAVGIVVASVVLGSAYPHIVDPAIRKSVGFSVLLVSAVSAVLSLQGAAMGYAENDHAGETLKIRQQANDQKIALYSGDRNVIARSLKTKNSDCDKYNKWASCNGSEARLLGASAEIKAALDDKVAAATAAKINIGDAIYSKTGVPGHYITAAIVWARAIGLPFVIAAISAVFSTLLRELFGELKTAQRRESGAKK